MLRRASLTVLCIVLLPGTVQAWDHHHHHSSSHHSGGDGCGHSSSSSSSSSSGHTPSATPSSADHRRVFVTSTQYAGAVGGLAAADAYCQASADGAGLQGTFRAWLSDAKTNAYDRIDDVGPWYSTADKEAFASKAALRGAPGAPLLDENGGYPSSAGAWSGTDASGVATGQDCDDWTNATSAVSATAGSTFVGDTSWGGGDAPLACDGKAPLICFEQ